MKTFEQIFRAARPHMILDRTRAESLHGAAVATAALAGPVAELGVFRGGSALLLSLSAEPRKIYLFDTFDGLPEPTAIDIHQRGEFTCGETSVRQVMAGRDCEFIAGRFPASVPDDFDARFSLVHIDGDLYETTRDGLAFFWPRLEVGGQIVLDDYNWPNCPGVRAAVDELFRPGARDPVFFKQNAPYQMIIERVG